MSDVIEIRGLRISAVVGVLAEERTRAQPLLIDLDLVRSFAAAAQTDDLRATTNYAAILDEVVEIVMTTQYLLLETLAHHIARTLLEEHEAVDSVMVRVHKTRPPVAHDVATVGVHCVVQRN